MSRAAASRALATKSDTVTSRSQPTGTRRAPVTHGKRTIVLDLDNTLIVSENRVSAYNCPHFTVLDSDLLGPTDKVIMTVYLRPGVREFLQWAQKYFTYVVIWSAGEPRYVLAVVRKIFLDIGCPNIIWTDVNLDGTIEAPLKTLTKLRKSYPEIDFGEMVIIDDRKDVCSCNPDQLLEIPPFEVENVEHPDRCLDRIRDWLIANEGKWSGKKDSLFS